MDVMMAVLLRPSRGCATCTGHREGLGALCQLVQIWPTRQDALGHVSAHVLGRVLHIGLQEKGQENGSWG
jgi:hypothetical protein